MMRKPVFALAAALLAFSPVAATGTRTIPGVADPYKTDAFHPDADPMAQIDAALAAARSSSKR
ncbi:MAG TPA: hypothetical protein VJM13_05665, partial [Sphingopyxis sp.]|nr:hypothetical protein [Sphingopyxis sp.]